MNKEITKIKTISRKLICYPALLISKEQFFAEYLANDISCNLPPFAMGVSVYISTLTMTIIAIDRYVKNNLRLINHLIPMNIIYNR